jgi:hypothetical protein
MNTEFIRVIMKCGHIALVKNDPKVIKSAQRRICNDCAKY